MGNGMRVMGKTALSVILVIGLMIGGAAIITPVSVGDAQEKQRVLAPHAPIRIDSDADFPGVATGGDGSAATPWEIENYEINGTGTGPCIYVANTTDHFNIMNCTLNNSRGQALYPFFMGGGIVISNSSFSTVHNNTLVNNSYGILIHDCFMINVTQNDAHNNMDNGIQLSDSYNCTIENNTLMDNNIGFNASIVLYTNLLFHNGFFNNTVNIVDDGAMIWDGDYPLGGNYYDTHTGPDADLDGVCDNPYIIDGNSIDRYPLMAPYAGQSFAEGLPPYALGFSPNGTLAPIYSPIMIHWNETMNWTSVEEAFNYTDNVTVWNSSNGTWAHNYTANTSVFTPTEALNYSTEYWVNINVTAKDLANNLLDQDKNGTGGYWPADVLSWNFTTIYEDVYLPFAKAHGPNGTAVPIDAQFVIVWNETMNWTSVEEAFGYSNGTTVFDSSDGMWSHIESTNTSTFTPSAYLMLDTTYDVSINSSATDINGNNLDGNKNGTVDDWPEDVLTWNFTTGEPPPVVLSTYPDDGLTEVDPNTEIMVQFSKPMHMAFTQNGFSVSDGLTNLTVADGTVTWNPAMTIMTFQPASALANNTTHTILLDSLWVRDQGGSNLDGDRDGVGGDNFTSQFTTWLDPPLPKVIHTNPPDGSSNIPANMILNLIFNIEMNTASVEDAFSYTNGILEKDSSSGTVEWFDDDKVFSFRPAVILDYDAVYTVTLNSSARSAYDMPLDGNGNDVIEVGDDHVFSFSTAPKPPEVTSSYPINGDIGVPVDIGAIMLNFSKSMDTVSVLNGLTVTPTFGFTSVWQGQDMNLTLVLNQTLAEATQYLISIHGLATDVDGNRIDGNGDGLGGDEYMLRFTVASSIDQTPPVVEDVFPDHNSTGVLINTFIAVDFSKVMNRTAVENAFTVMNGSTTVNGSFSWSVSGTAFKFTPTSALAYNTTYTARLSASASDLDGNTIGNDVAWQFVTESESAGSSLDEIWWLLAVIFMLSVIICAQYIRGRALRMKMRRANVEIKKLRKELGKRSADQTDASVDKATNGDAGEIPDALSNTQGVEEKGPGGKPSVTNDTTPEGGPPENKP